MSDNERNFEPKYEGSEVFNARKIDSPVRGHCAEEGKAVLVRVKMLADRSGKMTKSGLDRMGD